MHEVGLCQAVLKTVEQRAQGRTVHRVRVRAGVLNRIDEASMRQAFTLVSEGSVAQGAELDLELVPIDVECAACSDTSTTQEVVVVCPRCGSTDLQLRGGDELTLVSLDVAAAPVSG
jgi:hydrogenase nickel incorporation protein HypA/HybF